MPQIIDTPGRWIRNCQDFPVDPCDALTPGDWNFEEWVLSGGLVSCIYLLPNLVDGLIATIDSYPDGGIYNSAGSKLADIIYNAVSGCYEPTALFVPDFTTYALIEGIDVTLNDGTSCTHEFRQFFDQTSEIPNPPTDEFAFTTNIGGSISFVIGNSVGTVDWGDGTIDNYDASGGTDTVSHSYAAGTFELKVYNGFDSDRIDAQNDGLLSADLQRANQWAELDLSNNLSLSTILWPSVHNVLTTLINLSATNLSIIDLSTIQRKGGVLTAQNAANLNFVNFGSSNDLISTLNFEGCDLNQNINISGLTLDGTITFEDNTNLPGLNIGSQTGVITELNVLNCDLSAFDISGLTQLEGILILRNNSNLQNVTWGSSSGVFTIFRCNNCDILSADLSGYTGLGGDLQIQNNANMATLLNPTSSEVFTRYLAGDCSLTAWDGSGLSGLGGEFSIEDNDITTMSFPTSSETFTTFEIQFNDQTTTDLSNLSGLGGGIFMQACFNLTTLTLPSSTNPVTALWCQNCDLAYFDLTVMTFDAAVVIQLQSNGMTVTEVNHMLVDLDNTLPTPGTGSINISGTNAAPDGSSGGYDGITAKNNLIANGYSVTTS